MRPLGQILSNSQTTQTDAAFVSQTKVGIDKSNGRRSPEPSSEQCVGRKCVASEALLLDESPACWGRIK
jgi:hypothetical protein